MTIFEFTIIVDLVHGGSGQSGRFCWVCAAGSGRRGGLMVSLLDSGSGDTGSGLGRDTACVLGQHTLLSQYLYSPTCINGCRRIYCWGQPCDGLASHRGGVQILLVSSCKGNRVKLCSDGPLGSNREFTFYLCATGVSELQPHYSLFLVYFVANYRPHLSHFWVL